MFGAAAGLALSGAYYNNYYAPYAYAPYPYAYGYAPAPYAYYGYAPAPRVYYAPYSPLNGY